MNGFLRSLLASGFAGIGGTCIGAIIALIINKVIKKRKKDTIEIYFKSLIGFSGGIMIVVICFDLILGAYSYVDLISSLFAVSLGCIIIPILEMLTTIIKTKRHKMISSYKNQDNYKKISIIIFFSIALHNFPEGLAVGSSFSASVEYGISLAAVIALHNIPEGISLATPMIAINKKAQTILFLAFLSGLPTIVGSSIGWYVSRISQEFIGLCLGFAGGAMLYIVLGQLFPLSYKSKSSKASIVLIIIGFFIGLIITS